ncbi:hypothetical protein B0H10DRAFT_1952224 [Mycena sp. CBHHK59/15]|nr:hypothetical protein B0H10DRAFT_1952224 [Mycena sp. CBHHK59/15]
MRDMSGGSGAGGAWMWGFDAMGLRGVGVCSEGFVDSGARRKERWRSWGEKKQAMVSTDTKRTDVTHLDAVARKLRAAEMGAEMLGNPSALRGSGAQVGEWAQRVAGRWPHTRQPQGVRGMTLESTAAEKRTQWRTKTAPQPRDSDARGQPAQRPSPRLHRPEQSGADEEGREGNSPVRAGKQMRRHSGTLGAAYGVATTSSECGPRGNVRAVVAAVVRETTEGSVSAVASGRDGWSRPSRSAAGRAVVRAQGRCAAGAFVHIGTWALGTKGRRKGRATSSARTTIRGIADVSAGAAIGGPIKKELWTPKAGD